MDLLNCVDQFQYFHSKKLCQTYRIETMNWKYSISAYAVPDSPILTPHMAMKWCQSSTFGSHCGVLASCQKRTCKMPAGLTNSDLCQQYHSLVQVFVGPWRWIKPQKGVGFIGHCCNWICLLPCPILPFCSMHPLPSSHHLHKLTGTSRHLPSLVAAASQCAPAYLLLQHICQA